MKNMKNNASVTGSHTNTVYCESHQMEIVFSQMEIVFLTSMIYSFVQQRCIKLIRNVSVYFK